MHYFCLSYTLPLFLLPWFPHEAQHIPGKEAFPGCAQQSTASYISVGNMGLAPEFLGDCSCIAFAYRSHILLFDISAKASNIHSVQHNFFFNMWENLSFSVPFLLLYFLLTFLVLFLLSNLSGLYNQVGEYTTWLQRCGAVIVRKSGFCSCSSA